MLLKKEICTKATDKQKLVVWYRPETTDEKVIPEVLQKNVYQSNKFKFFLEPGDRWLDLGGNIGTFSLLCLNKGLFVVTFEPEPENFNLLTKNIDTNFPKTKLFKGFQKAIGLASGKLPLYICKGDYNKYRHTLCPKRGRQTIQVSMVPITKMIQKYNINCIKIDIEGYEIELLEKIHLDDFKAIKKLVYEYSFDIDKSIPRFLKIIQKLRKHFKHVSYDKVKDDELEYNYFPPCVNVYCTVS